MKANKILAVLLCIVLMAACFAGCGGGGSSTVDTPPESQAPAAENNPADSEAPEATPADTGEKTALSFWHVNADGMDKYIPDGFKERFEEAYPQYDLEITAVPGTAADFETKFNSAKMSGTLPDLTYLTLTSFASLGTRGEFLAIDDRINAWSDKDDFLPAALDMGKVGGKYTGVGVAPAPATLFYRTDMFEAAGLDPDKPPTTWEEIAEYAEKLTIRDANGNVTQSGLDIPSIDYFLNFSEPFMLMNGATVVDEVEGKPMLTEPEVIETLEFLYEQYSKNITLPHDWQKRETIPFMNGVGAMTFTAVDNYNVFKEDKPEAAEFIRMAPPIQNKKASAFCGYRLLAVTTDSKNVDGAWDLINFYCAPEEMKTRVNMCSVIPVRASIQDYYVEKYPDYGQTVVDTVAVGKGAFVVPWVATLYKYYGPAYESIMQGKATPTAAMEEAQNQILAEIG